jgi:protein SCO1/2
MIEDSCGRLECAIMRASQKIIVGAAASLSLTLLAAIAIWQIGQKPQSLLRATELPAPLPLPDFQLLDQDGAPFTRNSLLERHTLVFFGFTHCPDICPATLQQLALARTALGGRLPDGSKLPDILLISVDPIRDTPETLKAYTGYFGPGAYGATGERENLTALTSALGIFYETGDTTKGDYEVSHSAAVLFVNEQAELQAIFGAPHDVDSFVSDLLILMDES